MTDYIGEKNADFLLGGKSMGTVPMTLSLVARWVERYVVLAEETSVVKSNWLFVPEFSNFKFSNFKEYFLVDS